MWCWTYLSLVRLRPTGSISHSSLYSLGEKKCGENKTKWTKQNEPKEHSVIHEGPRWSTRYVDHGYGSIQIEKSCVGNKSLVDIGLPPVFLDGRATSERVQSMSRLSNLTWWCRAGTGAWAGTPTSMKKPSVSLLYLIVSVLQKFRKPF